MVLFRFLKMAVAAILDCRISGNLTVGTVKSVALHHGAKFCRNWSIRGRDIAIYRFLKMAAAILDLQTSNSGRSRGPSGVTVPNFVETSQTTAEIW